LKARAPELLSVSIDTLERLRCQIFAWRSGRRMQFAVRDPHRWVDEDAADR